MIIRPETLSDHQEINQLITLAFATAEHSDGTEQDLVERLRFDPAFIPELALVAEQQNKIVGYILFSQLRIGQHIAVALAPLAVHPDFQKQGVGSSLILKGHQIAKELGYHHSIVLGDPNYYAKFGYQTAKPFGIVAPFEIPDEYFMISSLDSSDITVSGPVIYAEAFNI